MTDRGDSGGHGGSGPTPVLDLAAYREYLERHAAFDSIISSIHEDLGFGGDRGNPFAHPVSRAIAKSIETEVKGLARSEETWTVAYDSFHRYLMLALTGPDGSRTDFVPQTEIVERGIGRVMDRIREEAG